MTEANLAANIGSAEIPAMPFGFTLNRVYRILRDHLKLFLGIAAPPAVAMIVLYGAMFGLMFNSLRPYLTQSGGPVARITEQFAIMRIMFPSMLVAIVPMLVVFAFYFSAAFIAATKIDSGIGTSVGECFREAWAGLGRSLGLFLWIYLRAFGAVLVLEIVLFGVSGWFAFSGSVENPPVAAFAVVPLVWLLFMVACVYGIIVALRLSLAFPASIEEGLTAREAIRRSVYLTQGSKVRIFLLLLVLYAIAYAVIFVLYIVGLLVFAIGALGVSAMQPHLTTGWIVVLVVVGVLFMLCFLYFWTALLYGGFIVTLSVVYHDQRRRKDAPLQAQLPTAGLELPPGEEPA